MPETFHYPTIEEAVEVSKKARQSLAGLAIKRITNGLSTEEVRAGFAQIELDVARNDLRNHLEKTRAAKAIITEQIDELERQRTLLDEQEGVIVDELTLADETPDPFSTTR